MWTETVKVISMPLALSVFVWLLHLGFELVQSDEREAQGEIKDKFNGILKESLIAVPVDVTLLSSSVLVEILLTENNATSAASIISISGYFIFLVLMIIAGHICKKLWKAKSHEPNDGHEAVVDDAKTMAMKITTTTSICAGLLLVLLFVGWLFLNV